MDTRRRTIGSSFYWGQEGANSGRERGQLEGTGQSITGFSWLVIPVEFLVSGGVKRGASNRKTPVYRDLNQEK